jgi:diaminopimelate decarboxylase
MAYFYRDGVLKVGSSSVFADVGELAKAEGRPTYIYDLGDIKTRFEAYRSALGALNSSIHYAMKANSHPLLLKRLASWGAGVDTVSAGEVKRAIEAGFKPEKIIFSGVAKTKKEIEYAVSQGIKQINVESPAELRRIVEIARKLGKKIDVAFRMNPDVDPKTHPYITTGFRENKFGMDESFLPELIATLRDSKDYVQLRGLTMHIGSLLFDLGVLKEALEKTLLVHSHLEEQGFTLDRFDIGGGLGIRYETDDVTDEMQMLKTYGDMVTQVFTSRFGAKPKIEILAEPGRIIVARSGLLVSEVQYVKRAPAKTFAVVDTGMHHLLRPALYQAKHRILPVAPSHSAPQSYDVVGPICESSDVLAKNVSLPEVKEGDLLAIADAGAYGFAMANTYNSHELPSEVVIEDGKPVP